MWRAKTRELRPATLWPAPFLRSWTTKDVEEFRDGLLRYRADRGEARIVDLMDQDLLALLETIRIGFRDLQEGEQLEFLLKLKSESADQVMERLRAMRMTGTGLERYMIYATAFRKQWRKLEVVGEIPSTSKRLLKYFLTGLEPARLQRRMCLRLDGEPPETSAGCERRTVDDEDVAPGLQVADNEDAELILKQSSESTARPHWSLDQLMRTTLEAVQEEEKARALLGQRMVGEGPTVTESPVGGTPYKGSRAGIKCHKCGKLGHIARDCRSKRKDPEVNLAISATTPGGKVRGQDAGQGTVAGQREPRRCYTCGDTTHLANACPKRTRYVRQEPPVTRSQTHDEGAPGTSQVKMLSDELSSGAFLVSTKLGPKEREWKALIDTGANNSFIAPGRFGDLVEDGAEVVDMPMTVTTAGGQTLTSREGVKVMLQVEGVKHMVTLHNLPGLSEDLIVGMDTLTSLGLDLDVRERRLICQVEVAEMQEDLQKQLWVSEELSKEELQGLVGKASPTLRPRLEAVVRRYADLFGSLPPEGSSLERHRIPLKENAVPVCQPLRRLSLNQRKYVTGELDRLLQQGVIRESKSSWASPMVLVRKRSGEWRLCIDFRRLNEATVRELYPLPRLDDLFDALHGQKFFAVLDMNSGYHQVRMLEEDIHKTAFIAPDGLFEYARMPFGLVSAPATFQRGMNALLAELRWQVCLVYLDDIIIFGRTEEEFLCHLEKVFQRLQGAKVRLNGKKSELGLREVSYLGQIVSVEGRRVDQNRLQGLRDLMAPRNVKQLKSFLSLVSYYRSYLKDLSTVASPLYALVKSNVKFRWDAEQEQAFQGMKEMLLTAPLLRHPNFEMPFVLQTDASDEGIGGVLLQDEKPILFLSRTLTGAERRWATIDKEAYAIVWSLSKLRAYLLDRPFVIRCDHRNLQFISTCKSARVQRWRLSMAEFDYTVEYVPGRENVVADTLSRLCVVHEVEPEGPAQLEGFLEQVQVAQETAPVEERSKWEKDERFEKEPEGLWMCLVDGRQVVVIPDEALALKAKLCTLAHAHVLAGHFGVDRMVTALKEKVWWSHMSAEVREFVAQCPSCQRKGSKGTAGPALSTMVTQAMDTWHVDFVGPLPESERHNQHILVMVDRFTRYVELVACQRANAQEAVQGILDGIICRHGIPRRIVSDGGSHFQNRVLEEVCRLLDVEHHVVIPYHPAANGAVERQNRVLMDTLRATLLQVENWDALLAPIQFAMNCAQSRATGQSPFKLLYGREPGTPLARFTELHGMDEPPKVNENDEQERARCKVWWMHHLWAEANSKQAAAWKKLEEKQTKDLVEFEPGALVLLRSLRRPTKLAHRWRGPFRVKKKINPVVWVVTNLITEEEDQVHISRLKAFNPGSLEDQQVLSEALPRGEYLVERVLSHETKKGKLWFNIKWLGWEETTCEPEDNVGHTSVVKQYAREHSLILKG